MNIPNTKLPRVVIIGGGFAGIALARKLRRKRVQLVVIDRHNYHNFQPLLYQVATGGLEAGSIAYPIRKIFQDFPECYFRMAHVREVDSKAKVIHTDIGDLHYDYLVMATGSKTNFFGNKEIERNTMNMKSIPQALNLRSLIFENFENAVLAIDPSEKKCLMNFIIVGGGPTGVELAGALAEMKKGILHKDYPDLEINFMEINLIQSGDRILNTMSEKSSAASEGYLTGLGVKIWKNLRVLSYDGRTVTTNTGKSFESSCVIWTAGVMGKTIAGLPASAISRSNRIRVNEYNQVIGEPSIFAIGDIAQMETPDFPDGHPMMAQPAIQQGRHLGENLLLLFEGRQMQPFRYADKGSMATIGRNKAVVDLPRVHFHGFFAWVMWIFVHLFSLIGFKNKAVVLMNWIYNYINFDREGRLIIRPYKKKSFSAFTTDEI